jgi:hypothetical protein
MAADNQLNISVIVDASQLTSALPQATAVVDDAFTSLAAAQIRVSTASKELNSTLNTLAKSGLAPTAEQTEEVAAAMFEAKSAASAFSAAEEQAYGSTEKLTTGANNARAAFMGLNRELGLGGNRALSTFISQSETLGPILSQAFTGIAIAGFIQLAVLAAGKLEKLISDTFIFTKAEQDSAAQIEKDNKTIEESYQRHIAALREISLIGLGKTEQDALRVKYASEDVDYAQRAVDATTKQVAVETQKLNVLEAQLKKQKESFSYTGPGAGPQLDFGPQVAAQQVVVQNLNSTLGALQAALRDASDAAKKANKSFTVAEADDYKAALDRAAKSTEQFITKMQHLASERDRITREGEKLAQEETRFFAAEQEKESAAQLKELSERADAEKKFAADRLRDAESEATAEITAREKSVQEQLKLGQITSQQALAQLNALANQKLAIEMKYLTDRAAQIQSRLASDDAKAYAEDLAEWSKLLSDKQKAEQQYDAAIQANNEKTAIASEKPWQSMFRQIQSGMDGLVRSMIQGSGSIAASFIKLGGDLLVIMTEALAKILLKHIAHWIAVNIIEKNATLQSIANLVTGNVTKQSLTSAANVALVTSEAGVAGAAGFASVMLAVPFPLNVSMAPEVAAAAIAGTMSVGSIASAAGGMLVPKDMLANVHKDERILPARYSSGLDKMVAGADSGFGGDGDTFHIHMGDVHATDKRGVEALMREQADTLIDIFKRAKREFRA